MILYCDTSALIKRYVEEEGTGDVDAVWDKAVEVATSVAAFAESMAAFYRKLKEGVFSTVEYSQTIAEFKNEYLRLLLIPITSELNLIIEKLIKKYSLRGFDAIHLASAIVIHKGKHLTTKFACFDKNLNRAAKLEGLDVPFL